MRVYFSYFWICKLLSIEYAENYNYVENREQLNKTKNDTRYNLGNPFKRKLAWKVKLICSIYLNGKWMQVQRSEACGLWDATMLK